jgi:hypothetical protein
MYSQHNNEKNKLIKIKKKINHCFSVTCAFTTCQYNWISNSYKNYIKLVRHWERVKGVL